MTDTEPEPEPVDDAENAEPSKLPTDPAANASPVRPRRVTRRRVLIGTGIVIALFIATAVGAATVTPADSQVDAARKDAARIRSDARDNAAQLREDAESDADATRAKAEDAATKTKQDAQAQIASLKDDQAALRTQIKASTGKLNATKKQLTSATRAVQRSTIDEDGTFLVGSEVSAGTYRATDAPSDCYWARLSGTGGSDIIDNGGFGGQQIITISSSDNAFETRGCGVWKKIG